MEKNETLANISSDTNHKSESEKITKSAAVVACFTFLSRIFGMVRDIVIFHIFGATAKTDAFFIAFTIPNVLRRLVAEGALTISFIPIYSEIKQKDNQLAAKKFLASVFGLLLITLTVLTAMGILFAPTVVLGFASGFGDDANQFALTTDLTRILFPYIFLVSLVALAMGVLNSHNHFAYPAAAPILLNLSMIISVFFFSSLFSSPIYALAYGVIIGGILQVLLQIPILYKKQLLVWPSLKLKTEPMKKLFNMLLPAFFGLAVYQFNIIALRQLGSYLPSGQISYYYNADRLMQFALGVFAISIATAALPSMSKAIAKNGTKQLIDTWKFSTLLTNFIVIPAAFGLIFLALPIVCTLYFHGNFSWKDALYTSNTVIAFAPGLISISASRISIQAFFALQDTKTPVIIGLFTVMINLVLGIALLQFEVVGLAACFSITSWLQMAILLVCLRKKIALPFKEIILSAIKNIVMSLAACFCGWLIIVNGDFSLGTNLSNIAILLTSVLLTCAAYFSLAYFFTFNEFEHIQKIFISLYRRKKH